MSIRNLPQACPPQRPQNFQWDAPSDALARWADGPQAAASNDDATITIYDVIGTDWWTGEGVTSKRIAGALRSIGERDVTVNINSPGGDMFEGIAIYNLLAAHKARVTVNVISLAASAASIIAMAGDTINMGVGSFIMIHNAWGVVIGNQNDFREAADVFAGFDGALADIYEARTGLKRSEIVALMDAETFMGSDDAIRRGFADGTMTDEIDGTASNAIDPAILAKRKIDAVLAASHMPRSERRRMMRDLTGTHNATGPAKHDAGSNEAGLRAMIETFKV